MYKLLATLMLGSLFFAACTTSATTTPSHTGNSMSNNSDTSVLLAANEPVHVASNFTDYNKEAYEAALAEGKTVFLDFHASWCSTCLSNAPKIEAAFEKLEDDSIVGFRADYDKETALKRQLGVNFQSTLLLVRPDGSTTQLGPGFVSENQVISFLES